MDETPASSFFTNALPVDPDERIGASLACTCGCDTELAVTYEGYVEIGNEDTGYHGLWLSLENATKLVEKLQTYIVNETP